jgi:xanthine dehydrogenase YagS FAD-binding subunit
VKSFDHINARTTGEVIDLLGLHKEKAMLIAGGTDLLGILKDRIFPQYPEVIINIKTITDLSYITQDAEGLRIGALTRLTDIARSPLVRENYSSLAEASNVVATPQIRNLATLGGNLCQDIRCWYYRYPHQIGNRITCLRKGTGPCHAVAGDNRYHAIMGGRKCFAVCPSDTAIALAALDASMEIVGPGGSRTILVKDFFGILNNGLKKDEIVTEIRVPKLEGQTRQRFDKFTLRKSVAFAVVSVASIISTENGICKNARIALGAVAAVPLRATEAETFLKGKSLDKELAEEAAGIALSEAKPLTMNSYKVQIAKTLVKRGIMQ